MKILHVHNNKETFSFHGDRSIKNLKVNLFQSKAFVKSELPKTGVAKRDSSLLYMGGPLNRLKLRNTVYFFELQKKVLFF